MLYFLSGNITSGPVNQQICNNRINFKENYHSNYKQGNHGGSYYRKTYLKKDWFQWASSQTKQKIFKNN